VRNIQSVCHRRASGLDFTRIAGLNHRVRAVAVTLVLLAASTAFARPRVQVPPFQVRGEALGYFGPEVARAVAAALEGAGVETGPGGEATISGRIDELSGDRVRLSATLRGRTLTAEGPLEAIDAVATQLANQIAPLLLENDPAAQRAAEKRAREAERRAAAVPPSAPARPSRPARPSTAPASAPRPVEASAEAKPEAKSEAPKPETKTEAPKTEAPKTEPRPESKPEAPKVEAKPSEVKEPDWSPPRVDTPPPSPPRPDVAPTVTQPPPYFGGYVRGRVVAHAVADPPNAYPGSGVTATQALFGFLHRRLRVTVIPTGVGITAPSVAADEGYRAGARAVVMARLDGVDYMPGPSVRCRLEVIVVRDGRPVMRRLVESAPSDPSRRGPGADPVFQAVTMALDALVPELMGALADVR
jgi:hypothetical protein